MTLIVFIEHNGKRHEVNATDGDSLMRAALDNNVPGILGDCGGCRACATCHAFVDPTRFDCLPPPSAEEAALLEGSTAPQPNSRLSCQVTVSPALEGLVVRLPASQF